MKLHPDWTADAFKGLDRDGDGALSQAEYDTTSAPAASTDASSKTNAATAPGDTTASTTAATTENNASVATKRKMGPATYVDQVGANDVLASTLIGMRVYAVESDIDDTKTYPADSRQNWDDIGEVNDVVWTGTAALRR
jgi:hypothetical protein